MNARLYDRGPAATREASNHDLWARLWAALRARSAPTDIQWIKGHATAKDVSAGTTTDKDKYGNEQADRLAGQAAAMHIVSLTEAAQVMWSKSLVIKIQKRLVSVIMGLEKRPRPAKRLELPKPPNQLSMAALRSTHQLQEVGDHSYWCTSCKRLSPQHKQAKLQWLQAPCAPPPPQAQGHRPTRPDQQAQRRLAGSVQAHPSHDLQEYRGLFFCERCGAYGSERVRRLAKPCQAPADSGPKAHWRYAVLRIKRGQLPSGMAAWPDEKALKTELKVREGLAAAAADSPPEQPAASSTEQTPLPAAAEADFRAPATKEEKKARRRYLAEQAKSPAPPLAFEPWLRQLRLRRR
jgi:hypothetical protein